MQRHNMSQSNINSIVTNQTPMMLQYLNIKAQYKEAILFYRMGDFYEMFFEDAVIAAEILNITLTKRGKHESQDIPMCGVPFHSSESYLHKLINSGLNVAICEQLETPEEAKKRGYKAVVRREVVRLVTPGTLIEENLLNAKESNYLISVCAHKEEYAISWIDISTAEFAVKKTNLHSLNADIARLKPKEILISDHLLAQEDIRKQMLDWKRNLSTQDKSFFDLAKCTRNLLSFYNINNIESIGDLSLAQTISLGSIIAYLSITQKNNMPKLKLPELTDKILFMEIDNSSRESLEIFPSTQVNKKNCLLSSIDNTVTNMGARLLAKYLSSPLLDPQIINQRLLIVDFFYHNQKFLLDIRNYLLEITDLERLTCKLLLNKAGPRDLKLILNGLINIRKLTIFFLDSNLELPQQVNNMLKEFTLFDHLINQLEAALLEEAPILARDGGFVNPEYHPKIFEFTNLTQNQQQEIDKLKQEYIKLSGIANLKISRNNILGYFIEISPQHVAKMTSDQFIHRQTLASSVRYTTLELKHLEENIIIAKDSLINLELEIFNNLCQIIIDHSDKLLLAAQNIATIDVFTNFAFIAKKKNYTKPIIDNSLSFKIISGRHPVVEDALQNENKQFNANNCDVSESQNIWLLTGPNMAGKSTFLRQNALIAIIAQIGSFVPAEFAHIGIIDRVFSRVGAADDLARGRSTFMVEMIETSVILNQATDRSFIILDEIGRGTSTYDGLSIAWSSLEYIHNKIKSRTLFATHYHELSKLEETLDNMFCYSMAIKEWQNNIIFLHSVQQGSADKSYGVHVAQLAGLPEVVINRATQLLTYFENKDRQSSKNNHDNEPIDITNNIATEQNNMLINLLEEVDINNLTPLEAMSILYKLKQLL
jgi:DNA mismatch repair protein MutS